MIPITSQLVGMPVDALQSVECKDVRDVDVPSSERPPLRAVGCAMVVVMPSEAADDTFVAAIVDNVADKQHRVLSLVDALDKSPLWLQPVAERDTPFLLEEAA